MRREDFEHLQEPYSPRVPNLAAALGVATPSVSSLGEDIAGDLDLAIGGIGWWAPHLGAARRILISDQLYLCTTSIEANLHFLEALVAGDETERRLISSVKVVGDSAAFTHPESTKPSDDLADHLRVMHIVGAIRALASALDCLGSVIVGVVALPMPILTSGLRDTLGGLKQLAPGAVPVQVDACARVDDAFRTAGPEGWQEWVQDYRNMLVHRGRRLQTAQLRPKGVEIHTPRDELIAPHAVVPRPA